ncbi:MAG: hypothetical protein EAX90_11845 [Candidatus Heimdallarchaeota archaeon]|nr:hypothetical protein [Candidatus Heimdallarchaeota archaeon]
MNDFGDTTLVKLNIKDIKSGIVYIVVKMFQTYYPDKAEKMANDFISEYNRRLEEHDSEDINDFDKLARMINVFKPSLETIIERNQEFYLICEVASTSFDVFLESAKRQMAGISPMKPTNGPFMPGSSSESDIKYFCTVCKEFFDIPKDEKLKILNSDDEDLRIPKHHDKEMIIQIINTKKVHEFDKEKQTRLQPHERASYLMGANGLGGSDPEFLQVTSVGIDIGSSTSHLIFSKLTLRREIGFINMTNRFNLVKREIIYESEIILTPLLDRFTIDVDAIVEFCKKEYEKAGLKPEDVDTGAVIVTGETAKKQNADEIVERLSSESGKFVSATAGPNFESVLGAMGSGIVDRTAIEEKTYMNVDIGGGTSNIAIATKGDIHSTSCINVGGRLLGIEPDNKIWRIDEPTEFLMKEFGMKYNLGDKISDDDINKIVSEYVKALVEVMIGPAKSTITKGIMMTDDLDFSIPVDGYSFSGGVAEVIYDEENIQEYNDIGILLAKEIKRLMKEKGLPLIEPENKIRATVIGAGAFSLSVSGSTCYYEKSVSLPILNIPVVLVNIEQSELHLIDKKLKGAINLALKNYDLIEGEDSFALYFKTPFMRAQIMEKFASAIVNALPNSTKKKKLIVLILAFDGAKVLGITIRENTSIKSNLFCLDELDLEVGDWIDIGAPLKTGDAFPVTVKSLVFNKNKK